MRWLDTSVCGTFVLVLSGIQVVETITIFLSQASAKIFASGVTFT